MFFVYQKIILHLMALLQSLLKSLNLVSSFILQVKILRYSKILHKKQTNKYYLWLYNFTVWTLEDNNPVLMYIYRLKWETHLSSLNHYYCHWKSDSKVAWYVFTNRPNHSLFLLSMIISYYCIHILAECCFEHLVKVVIM